MIFFQANDLQNDKFEKAVFYVCIFNKKTAQFAFDAKNQ